MKTMKHWLETLALSLFFGVAAFSVSGCDRNDDLGDEIEDAADEVGDAAEEAGDEIEDAVE
jgi:predicted small secreted protein